MTLEKQVCSLELSKRLKELGVDADSQFYWEKLELKDWEKEAGVFDYCLSYFYDGTPFGEEEIFKAYTVAELGEMLPAQVINGTRLQIDKMPRGDWFVHYIPLNADSRTVSFLMQTEADARAKMLIYLLENSLITNI